MNKHAACLLETSEYDEGAFMPRPTPFGNTTQKPRISKFNENPQKTVSLGNCRTQFKTLYLQGPHSSVNLADTKF